MMDLGTVKRVTAINTWSARLSGTRDGHKLTIYGCASATDLGWILSRFTVIGTVMTDATEATFTAVSRCATGNKALGNYRGIVWSVWSVSPVSDLGGSENTAFQDLAAEAVGQVSNLPQKTEDQAGWKPAPQPLQPDPGRPCSRHRRDPSPKHFPGSQAFTRRECRSVLPSSC